MGIRFTAATPADEPGIRILLKDAGLPYEKFEAHLLTFITAKEGDALIGTMGMEVYGGVALLRSLVVTTSRRGAGIGGALYSRIEQLAHRKGVQTLYLLTQTAQHFFSRRGFNVIKREEAPAAIQNTGEFVSHCPLAAVCMKKEIRQASRR